MENGEVFFSLPLRVMKRTFLKFKIGSNKVLPTFEEVVSSMALGGIREAIGSLFFRLLSNPNLQQSCVLVPVTSSEFGSRWGRLKTQSKAQLSGAACDPRCLDPRLEPGVKPFSST
ncbi:hypothetical protein VNO77_34339 [Canavalia gladiata]|uniref:Uncharacterized protein n=1 Tax=Canavalia gladiata TaxID=3824 RepID=A0AAN9KFE4_CANGL